jgi:hypothetical protein
MKRWLSRTDENGLIESTQVCYNELIEKFILLTTVKGEIVCEHIMETYRGSKGIAPLILDLNMRWRWVVSFTRRPLYPRYSLNRRLCVSPGRYAGYAEKLFFLPGIELETFRNVF